jgi:hypothetical protein
MNEQAIRELQAKLIKIKNGEPVFFNLVQYQNLGLVKTRQVSNGYRKESNMSGIKTEYMLTPKAHQIISLAI